MYLQYSRVRNEREIQNINLNSWICSTSSKCNLGCQSDNKNDSCQANDQLVHSQKYNQKKNSFLSIFYDMNLMSDNTMYLYGQEKKEKH